jgi:hypothetical protein
MLSFGSMTLEEECCVHEEKDVPESVCPPKISHLLAWSRTQISAGTFFGLLVHYGNPTGIHKSLTKKQHSETLA